MTLGTAFFATDLLEWARKNNMEGSAKEEREIFFFF